MSEYQYYEFLAIDRPLAHEDMAALRRISSRAEITPTRLCNVYNFGDFSGNPRALMKKYFDAMVYVTNWGTRQLMLKLPRGAVTPEDIQPYCVEGALEMEADKEHVLLDFHQEDEEHSDWVEDREAAGWLPSLAPLRREIVRGERAALYLAWLRGAATDFDPELDEEPALEPPVPSGLRSLSQPSRALREFLRLDDGLVVAAAERSEDAAPEHLSPDLQAWLKRVPAAEKDGWLMRVATGDGAGIEGEVLRRFRADRRRVGRGAPSKPRTVAEILARAEVLDDERRAREAKAAARARARRARAEAAAQETRVAALAADEAGSWRAVEEHVASKSADRYADAVRMLGDLRVLAERSGRLAEFDAQLRLLRERHATKQAFLRRLREHGLGTRDSTGVRPEPRRPEHAVRLNPDRARRARRGALPVGRNASCFTRKGEASRRTTEPHANWWSPRAA